ncbi:MAG TPA: PP2C family serine/threonine-protein phosphatase [Symbiobacteriaceae bacterium]|nr:PP2C family serine/threonine-protein phosphatase [Symbiobacteriaceae bacterium]
MHVVFGQRSDLGRVRSTNQDACLIQSLDPRGNAALLIVADGMGGYVGGEEAARIAVETVRERVSVHAADWAENGLIGEGLLEAIQRANKAILQAQSLKPEWGHMGSTLTGVILWGERLFVGHIGDSKGMLISNRAAWQVTTDHNFANELWLSGQLTEEELRHHPQRHALTRALGMEETALIEKVETLWEEGDTLLLCSDGLSNLVPLTEIRTLSQSLPVEELVERLVDLANERGGSDNITVIAARWEGKA